MRKPLTAMGILGIAATMAAAAVPASAEIVIKLSHVTAVSGHPKGEAATLFAERVNEQMAGEDKISRLFLDRHDNAPPSFLTATRSWCAASLSGRSGVLSARLSRHGLAGGYGF
jgi:hypothetical protein